MAMRVKGTILLARRAFVVQRFGEEGWERVLQALPAEEGESLKHRLSPVGWYPFSLSQALDAAVVKVLGKGSSTVFEQMGASSARDNLATVHKDLLVVGDPQAFMKRAPIVYKFYYDKGHRTWEPTGPNSGILTTVDAETFSAVDCLTVVGWYREALTLCGAKDISIREPQCRAKGAPHCRYEFSWTM